MVPEGFQALGAFWIGPDGEMPKAWSLLSAATSHLGIKDTPVILACLGEEAGQLQYFLAPPVSSCTKLSGQYLECTIFGVYDVGLQMSFRSGICGVGVVERRTPIPRGKICASVEQQSIQLHWLLDMHFKEVLSPASHLVYVVPPSLFMTQFVSQQVTEEQETSSKKKRTDVQAVDQSALWEAHVPLRCSFPVLLQIPTSSPTFPTPQEIKTASEQVTHDLRAETAAFLVDSAKDASCSVLVQPWDEEASVTGRGFASGGAGTSGKKGGGKGKKKAAAQEAQGERNFDEMTCEELGAATEMSKSQKVWNS